MATTKSITAKCWICGDEFSVLVKDSTIISKCYHSYLDNHFFMGWVYGIDMHTIYFKTKYYRIIGYTKLQRWLVYAIWKIFHRGKIDYWECSRCLEIAEKDV